MASTPRGRLLKEFAKVSDTMGEHPAKPAIDRLTHIARTKEGLQVASAIVKLLDERMREVMRLHFD